ncbi:hypothetical protein [Oscillibacter sp.]|uniref:hypothetical protein n=1 Tax=Oscillibacter sp. TaxID=1945593 RepID=UPI002D80206A|nr:hypothetical protein [Oscillibacter sp.]
MDERISVRQWQETYRSGSFDFSSYSDLFRIGWSYWECSDKSLANRTKKLAKVLMGLTCPYILDNFCVSFRNRAYDELHFRALSENDSHKSFWVTLDEPGQRRRWSLFTGRYGAEGPEFDSQNVRDIVRYINLLGPELELDAKPLFIVERRAVELYAHRCCGEPRKLPIYQEGAHHYSYTSFKDGQQYMVMTSANAEDVPPGLKSEKIKGIHVWPVAGTEKERPQPQQKPHKSCKRKEQER